jgi:hypothetical protein
MFHHLVTCSHLDLNILISILFTTCGMYRAGEGGECAYISALDPLCEPPTTHF